jgi:hypothetical protein
LPEPASSGRKVLAVTLRISSAAAALLRRDAPREEKLRFTAEEHALPAAEEVTVLFFLALDTDAEVHGSARKRLRGVPLAVLADAVACRTLHPRVLDALARLHYRYGELATQIAVHPNCDDGTRAFLAERGIAAAVGVTTVHPVHTTEHPPQDEVPAEEDDEPVDEESEQFKSKYQLAQVMGVAEKIKIAQTGDKEWRMILIKDSNKLVSGTVIRNPRITESEVLAIVKSSIQNDEILRVVCASKEWLKNYQIRKALVENPKTPIHSALRLLTTLTEKDLSHLAKSKNIQTVLSTQARKLLIAKKEKR